MEFQVGRGKARHRIGERKGRKVRDDEGLDEQTPVVKPRSSLFMADGSCRSRQRSCRGSISMANLSQRKIPFSPLV